MKKVVLSRTQGAPGALNPGLSAWFIGSKGLQVYFHLQSKIDHTHFKGILKSWALILAL